MQIGAMSDHIESIKKGFLVLLPVLDEKGRAIIYGEPTLAEGEVDKVCFMFLSVGYSKSSCAYIFISFTQFLS